jgi:AcrR family transcriptional regulator
VSAAERRARRRERLLEAALEVFSTQGYASSTIRAISAKASLNSRYFYESFSSREDILYQLYSGIVADIATAVVEATAHERTIAEQAGAGMRASWKIFTDDPRKARIIVVEVVGVSERLELLRRQNRHAFADLLVHNSLSIAGNELQLRLNPVLTSRALMGGAMELLADWINGDLNVTVEQIIDHTTELFTAVAEASVAGAPREGTIRPTAAGAPTSARGSAKRRGSSGGKGARDGAKRRGSSGGKVATDGAKRRGSSGGKVATDGAKRDGSSGGKGASRKKPTAGSSRERAR